MKQRRSTLLAALAVVLGAAILTGRLMRGCAPVDTPPLPAPWAH